jgi:hypothetical protein
VNFTRDPVIETVITPKEGCKLVIRSSKGNSGEDYFVDAVEVVSFGNFLFFRSLERPKSFLLPISDYEVLELKETRMVLKTAGSEKSIKISGIKKEENLDEGDKSLEKKKRRSRKRKISANHKKKIENELRTIEENKTVSEGEILEENKKPFTRLFPPPPILIKEKLTKNKGNELPDEDVFVKDIQENVIEDKNTLSEVLVDSSENVTNNEKDLTE